MVILKLAFRNITHAGLRTWLNVIVLSIAFVAIVWVQGFINGMAKQAMEETIRAEIGGGQYWHKAYDRYDPLTIEDSHGALTPQMNELISSGKATAILMTSGAIFPDGRVQTAIIKGIDPDQSILEIPAHFLNTDNPDIVPALIGTRMAKQAKLKIGDFVTARWRDIHGTFDATDIQIVQIMKTNAPSIDSGQIWIPLDRMREMLQTPNEATLVTLKQDIESVPPGDGLWIHRDMDFLLKEITDLIKVKSGGSAILYVLLLAMALLAIFDTQVLAIFRRRKEMGTLMALGMPRSSVISLFTLEGSLHGLLALIVGAIWGMPLLYLTAVNGFGMPEATDSMGFALPNTLYPSYGLGLLLGTTLVILFTVTLVSFLPTRKIVKLKPTDALRGTSS
jgi:putative ABC transport system permease protein